MTRRDVLRFPATGPMTVKEGEFDSASLTGCGKAGEMRLIAGGPEHRHNSYLLAELYEPNIQITTIFASAVDLWLGRK